MESTRQCSDTEDSKLIVLKLIAQRSGKVEERKEEYLICSGSFFEKQDWVNKSVG